MVNAWSLLYEELNGTMDETYPIKEDVMTGIRSDVVVLGGEEKSKYWYDYDRNGNKDDPFESTDSDQSFWEEDGFSITGNPTGGADTISFTSGSYTYGAADTVAFTGSHLFGGMGEDHISFTGSAGTAYDKNEYYAAGYDPYPTLGGVDSLSFDKKPKPDLKGASVRKYQEDKSMKDLADYVSSTYQGHYTNDNSDVQTLDLIHSVGDAESFCRSNAIKYLSRYDKKGQAKRDILKAMHYCLLLYYFSGNSNNEITTRGYEAF